TPEEAWYAQLGLWVQQDIVDAIARANTGAANVTESLVKHLLRVEIPDNPYVLQARANANPGEAVDPMAVATADPNAPLPKHYEVSLTGRVSNPIYDVVQFRLIVNVDATRLPQFVQELTSGQLFYVREMSAVVVDSAQQMAQGFIYGKQPVVTVTLDCEELFLRAWTTQYMPEPVKLTLGVTSPPNNGGATDPATPW